jgi:hypothetical protein
LAIRLVDNARPILGVIVVVVALLVAVGLSLPRYPTIVRSTTIDAPPSSTFAIVSDLRRFNDWSPWYEPDPSAAYTFTGPVEGVGQTLNWKSGKPEMGSGKVSIESLDAGRSVALAIDFGAGKHAESRIVLKPAGTGTTVQWSLSADIGPGPMARYGGLAFDRRMGPDLERGLAKLKAVSR